MLSENIGFDYTEDDFVGFAAEGTLGHFIINNPKAQNKGGFVLLLDDPKTRTFQTTQDAVQFLTINTNKHVVCLVPEVNEQLSKNPQITFLTLDKTNDPHSVSKFKFNNSTALFGFYQWVNIVANQKPQSNFEQKVVEAFKAYFRNDKIEGLQQSIANIVRTIKANFEKGVIFDSNPNLIHGMKQFFSRIQRLKRKALIIVDVQNDFCQGGSMSVPNSNMIFGPINSLKRHIPFLTTILTKDMHPPNHISFASTHNMNPFVTIYDDNGVAQELWPDHCVVNTPGCEINHMLEVDGKEKVVEKGTKVEEDSYSGFGKEANPTGLLGILRGKRVQVVVVVGLALDFCVGSTALDAKEAGFDTYVMEEGTKAAMSHEMEKMLERLQTNEVKYVSFDEILRQFS